METRRNRPRWLVAAFGLAALLGASDRIGAWLVGDGVALAAHRTSITDLLHAPPAPAPAPEVADACVEGRGLVFPTGQLPSLTCDQARKVIAQARKLLATPAEPIDSARFAAATSDWLDPHGLWSVAPDAPVSPVLRKVAVRMIQDLEASPGSGKCVAATEVGKSLSGWVSELRDVAESARALAKNQPIDQKTRWE
ncbi:MAG: hypothetical protein JNK04_06780, partial [Myxococcales bacterium]|nr:hypothetical protein [Myxococcales bacterium]